MKKLLLILLFISSNAYASTVTIPTTYAANGTVTSTNLNGNFTALANTVNGGLDNNNVDTTSGYRLPKTVAALPSAGTQGAVYFLTSDNTLNFDNGSTFTKAVAVSGTPTTGDITYYNGGWSSLVAGTLNLPLVSNGAATLPTYKILPMTGGGTNANLSAVTIGAIPYFSATGTLAGLAAGTSGQVPVSSGAGAPAWANSLSSVSDYGTSASSSTARQGTAIKIAYGQIAISGSSNQALSNLPFSSSTSYSLTCSFSSRQTASEACEAVPSSGSAATIYNNDNLAQTISWQAIGT